MKQSRILLISISLILISCSNKNISNNSKPPYDIIGGWALSSKWSGYMSVTIQFKEDKTFLYWFQSDVKSNFDPEYPIKGNYQIIGNKIILSAKEKLIKNGFELGNLEDSLYSKEWFLYFDKTEIVLAPTRQWQNYLKGNKVDDSRFLYKASNFDPQKPYFNIMNKQDAQEMKAFLIDLNKIETKNE